MSALHQAKERAIANLSDAIEFIEQLGELFTAADEQLYLVGGSVRDALLGHECKDLDFTTSARPEIIMQILAPWADDIWDIGKDFGTISANKTLSDQQWLIEITTFRSDKYAADSRKPEVVFGDSIEMDLSRRDFTVNAMALAITGSTSEWAFVDFFNGLEDLADQLLRTPIDPQISFGDDPLRMMRAARFASQLGFALSPEVRDALSEMAGRIEIISAERVRDELSKILLTDNPRLGLNILVDSGLADYVLPELPALQLERDEHMRHKDVYQHSLTVLEQAIVLERERDYINGKPNPNHQPDLIVRLAALLHDIGKPATRRYEGGKVTFHNHDVVGAKLAKKRLTALRYPKQLIKAVCLLVELHLRCHGYTEGSSGGASCGWTDAAVRRYVRDAGEQLERLHILTRSDVTTQNPRKAERLRRAYDELEFRIDELAKEEELAAIRPDLDGNEIMTLLGVKPGKVVGEAYKYLLARRMEDGPLGREAAEQALLDWWNARQEAAPEA